MNYRKFYIILVIFAIVFTFFGGSLAWFTWTTSSSQETSIAFTVEQDFMCSADGGGNITTGDIYLMPTSSCLHETYAIQRTITVSPTLYNQNIGVAMDLWLDINEIGTGLSNSKNVKYALTTDSDSCTEGLVGSGTFNEKTTGGQVSLFTEKVYESTTTETYYLYIWIDSAETDSAIVDQPISLSLNGECRSESLKEKTAYAVYSADDTSLRFYKTSDVITEGSTYNGLTATAVYTGFESSSYSSTSVPWYSYRESITNVVVEDEISPISTRNWFYGFYNTINMDLSKLDTSGVTDMSFMFNSAGYNATTFELVGLDNWDVSSVTNMSNMFYKAGYNAATFDIGDISDWNTSIITSMGGMFEEAGYKATTWSIGDLSGWNTSSVTSMSSMFSRAGYSATTFELDLSGWDVSNVTSMSYMFYNAGNSATTWSIGDLSGWDVSNVTSMSYMFYNAGYSATTWSIGDLSGWDVSSVTNMNNMFNYAGRNATTWSIGDISKWDVSSVTNMSYMFHYTGRNATTWSIGDLSGWDVSSVTSMWGMFGDAGYSATTWSIGDISGWDVSSVTSMSSMFSYAGRNATTWSIGDISKWDTSSVTSMYQMFSYAGHKATYSLDLSGWTVTNVTSYSNFNNGVESKITPPVWVN